MSNPVGADTVDAYPFPSSLHNAPDLYGRVSLMPAIEKDRVIPGCRVWFSSFQGLPKVGRNCYLPGFITFAEESH